MSIPTANSLAAFPDPIRSIDSATFTGAYQAVSTPTTRPVRLIKFVNNSSVAVTISWDGINDHDFIPAGSFALYDVSTNKVYDTLAWYIRQGTQFYVKGAAGVRLFYIICIA